MQSTIKQMVLFGDSLSDAGNLKRWTKNYAFLSLLVRRSTGMFWNDYLTERTHLPVPPFGHGGAKPMGQMMPLIVIFRHSLWQLQCRNLFTGSSKYYVNSYFKNPV